MSLTGRLQSLLRAPTGGSRRLLQVLLLVSGVSLLLVASAFLLTGRWDSGPATPAAALQADLEEQNGEGAGTLDVGSALARVDADDLYGGLVRLTAALRPTPTPTASPAPKATPTTPPEPVPAQPAAAPQPVVAGQGGPAAPPPPPPPPPPPAPVAPSCPTAGMAGFGLALFNAINSERAQHGMPSLAAHGCVVYVAQLRSNDMASRGYFSHTSPEGETAFSLLDNNGVPHGWAGENLARNNYPDDQSVGVAIRDLMASEGHRANILSPNYTHMGVTVAFDGAGMKYYTMVFIGPP